MSAKALAALALLAAFATASLAQWSDGDAGYDGNRKPWKEIEPSLPPIPVPENLIPFEASAASPHRFYIDAASLTVGEDGVVRYTLVVKTAGGAANVTFEGIRCETREQKYYALGRSDGSWTRAREPRWRRVEIHEVNRQHFVLYADFFCQGKYGVGSAGQVVEALRRASVGLRR
jgi:hypothetical protein